MYHSWRFRLGFGGLGLTSVVFVTAAAGAVAQRTWVVDRAGGPGVDFLDIPPAVAAAKAGDRIEVRPHVRTYSGVHISKGIDLEAGPATYVPFISVSNVAFGAQLSIAGFSVDDPVSGPVVNCVRIVACQGAVMLSGLAIRTGVLARAGIEVEGCASVAVVDCLVTPIGGILGNVPMGLHGKSASITVCRSSIGGAPGADADRFANALPGAAGVSVVACNFYSTESTFRGGAGGAGGYGNCAGNGGDAIQGWNALVSGRCSILAGSGGPSAPPNCPSPSSGFAASGTVLVSADSVLRGALGNGARTVQAPSWVHSPGSLVQGQPSQLDVHAVPGSFALLLFDRQHFHTLIPSFTTAFQLSHGFLVGPVYLVPANGMVSHVYTLPRDPAWKNRFLFWQAVVVEPASGVELTSIADYRIR